MSVMFCDLVGSTSLSVHLDPEDLRETMARYHRLVTETAQHGGGFVARYLGDGVLVYFGWPRADEADPERSVRCGLAVIEALRHPGTEPRLSARVGIATGLTVVGDLLGEGAAREEAIVGEAPNLAARLQGFAEPNTVVIDAATRALIGGMFECRSLGPVFLKGWSDPIPAWLVEGPASVRSRSEAIYGRDLPPMIGRDDEIELLLRRWRSAVTGQGQAVLIAGEAGLGKSRLMVELEHRIGSEPHEQRRYFCSPYQQDTPLYPVTARWEREAGFTRGDTPEERLDKLQAAMGTGTPPEDFSLMADVLNLPAEGRLKLELSPQRQRERTFALLMRLLQERTAHNPVLMLVEDLHWADASSIELFDQAIRELSKLRVLLVMSFRPEFRAPWIGQADVTLLTLSRLNQRQAAALASDVLRDHALPPKLLGRVVAQTDGVPLFIEELARTVLERASPEDAALAVPTTLQASLLARLDRVPDAKQVAQIAAVIGREAPHTLLLEVADMPASALITGLDALVAASLMFHRGVAPDDSYVFKHALVQDAAYESLLRSRRAEIHGRIAAVLARNPEPGADIAATIGRHFAQAGQMEQAAGWYRRAGERSAERSATAETRAHLHRGLQIIAGLPDTPARWRLEAELQLVLGRMLLNNDGNGSLEAAAAFEQASELCRSLDQPEMLTRALWGRFTVLSHRGQLEEGRQIGLELMAVAKGDPKIQMPARANAGYVYFWTGRFAESRREFQSAIELADQAPDRRLNLAVTGSGDAHCVAYMAKALLLQGYVKEAVERRADALQRVDPRSPVTVALVHFVLCRVAYWLAERELLDSYARTVLAITEARGYAYFDASGRIIHGWLAASAGDPDAGLAEIDSAITALDEMGIVLNRGFALTVRTDCLLMARRHQDALATLDSALDFSARTGDEYVLAEIHRLKGELLLPRDPAAGEAQLRQALQVARRQEARFWELRAALSLARHLHGTGRPAQVRDLLAPLCDWFAPDVALPALADARGLLRELSL